jgi:hypothetical protein
MKGAFNYRPALPRYTQVWDDSVVLKYIKSIQICEEIGLKWLIYKLVMLMALLSGQRAQSLHFLNINHMTLLPDKVAFLYTTACKQSRRGFHVQPFIFMIPICV